MTVQDEEYLFTLLYEIRTLFAPIALVASNELAKRIDSVSDERGKSYIDIIDDVEKILEIAL